MIDWSATERAMVDVAHERHLQDKKWGEQYHDPATWLSILVEEVGEVGKEIAEAYAGPHELNPEAYRAGLVQVAAVAVAAIENLDRSMP